MEPRQLKCTEPLSWRILSVWRSGLTLRWNLAEGKLGWGLCWELGKFYYYPFGNYNYKNDEVCLFFILHTCKTIFADYVLTRQNKFITKISFQRLGQCTFLLWTLHGTNTHTHTPPPTHTHTPPLHVYASNMDHIFCYPIKDALVWLSPATRGQNGLFYV